MATERLLSPNQTQPDLERANYSLRPTHIDEYIGQRDLIERISITVEAVRARGEAMDHVLLHGPPGLGKTTLAYVIAAEMGSKVHATSGPALTKGTDLVSVLTRLEEGDVLFIDEIHRLPIAVEEFIYPAMEDFRIDVRLDSGAHARTVQITCKPFTLIGATTRAGLLSSPLRSRFGITHHLKYYTPADLETILIRSSGLLGIEGIDEGKASGGDSGKNGVDGGENGVDGGENGALETIANRSRGTPRIANRLLRRVRDFADVRAAGRFNAQVVADALELEGVDRLGLDELDRAYLRTIGGVYQGGPVGLEAVAATMNEDAGTLEDVVEPYLLQIGFLARTRRGRMLTQAGAEHVGVKFTPQIEPAQSPTAESSGLFT
jgi:holliday junction DNA helicase RuvB